MHASIIDMTFRLPVDRVLFDELRTDFLPRASQHPRFRGFQYVLVEQGRAVGILWYEQQRISMASPAWSAPGSKTTSHHGWPSLRRPSVAA